MRDFVFYHFGKRVTVHHNLPEKRFLRLYKKWSYESGQTDPQSFIEYINSRWLHRLMGWRTETGIKIRQI